jgi:FAD dependent oxidoreductase
MAIPSNTRNPVNSQNVSSGNARPVSANHNCNTTMQLRRPLSWFSQPADGATWFCDLLIVGGSTAAYAATLAALKAGRQRVCLVQPHSLLGGYYGPQAITSWHHGHLLRQPSSVNTPLMGEAFAMSHLQQTFRATYRTLEGQAAENEALLNQNVTVKAAAMTATMRQLLIPYLTKGQCQIIAQAIPTLTLYAERKNQPYRITQICFKSLQQSGSFRIHPKVVIDATESASGLLGLALDLAHHRAAIVARQTLTPFDFLPSAFPEQCARGSCFADSVGIAEVGLWQAAPHATTDKLRLPQILNQALAQSSPTLLPAPLQPLQAWCLGVAQQIQSQVRSQLQTWRPTLDNRLRGLPITLPLGCFLPSQVEGLVWAGHHIGLSEGLKDLGQFFPVAWATGEASAHIALMALQQPSRAINPLSTLATQSTQIQALQTQLLTHGVPLVWLDDIATDDPDFKEIQLLTLRNIIWFQNHRNLHFDPERIVSDDLLDLCLKTAPSLAPLTHRDLARQIYRSLTCYEDAQCLFPSLA